MFSRFFLFIGTRGEEKEILLSSSMSKNKVSLDSTQGEEILRSVHIFYYAENDEHVEHVKELVTMLRSDQIDAKADIYESLAASQNQPLYILTKLQKCDNVIIICSPSVKHAGKMLNKKKKNSSDKSGMLLRLMYNLRCFKKEYTYRLFLQISKLRISIPK